MLRTINTSIGKRYFFICQFCKKESPAIFVGVHHKDDALPAMALPHGWIQEIERDMRGRPIAAHYCQEHSSSCINF